MVVRLALIRGDERDEQRLGKCAADQLQPYRETVGAEAAGKEDGRQAREIACRDEAAERFRAIAKAGVDHANVMLPYGHELAGVKALAQVARDRFTDREGALAAEQR